MLSLKDLHPEQQDAITHIYEVGQTFLIGEMGSGKTATALYALSELLADGEIERVLVVSTGKIVRDVWPKEPDKWKEIAHLTDGVAVLTGQQTEKQRRDIIDGTRQIICINCTLRERTLKVASRAKFGRFSIDVSVHASSFSRSRLC